MPAVAFDFNKWIELFPEFAAVGSAQGAVYFDMADAYFANDTMNPAFIAGEEARFSRLLYMLTSHLAWLLAPRDASGNPSATGQAAPPLVGRINNASEGSVSVGVELKGSGSPSEEFFTQTKYGFMFWQATAQYRTMQYAAQPSYVPSAIFAAFPRGRRII